MAIFSAGFVEYSSSTKKLKNKIYEKAKTDLDSGAIKIATKGGKGYVNYIAFLPREKIQKTNILQLAHNLEGKNVIVFELDYSQVGVICEDGTVIDYILDKPQIFAKERGYEIKFADNFKGQKLQPINLQKQKTETFVTLFLLIFFIISISVGFYGGFEYVNKYKTYEVKKAVLQKEYEAIAQNNLQKALQKVQKVDSVKILNDVENITKQTATRLKQFSFNENKFCVMLLLNDNSNLDNYDFSKMQIIDTKEKQTFGYCYEKI